MKSRIFILIAISLLLQSCYTYKVIDKNSNLVIGKKYKIKQSEKYEEVRLLASEDSAITVNNSKNIKTTIAKTDIIVIKKRKFSIGKTAILGTTTLLVGATILLALGLPKIHYSSN